jgi:hypothetical protein
MSRRSKVYTIGSLADLDRAIGATLSLPDGGTVTDGAPPTTTTKPPLNGDGYPAGVTPAREGWLEDGRYKLQSGDTLSGLARTYLGDPARWREIWDLQPTATKLGKSPDKLPVGFVLVMPQGAQKKAKELSVLGPTASDKRVLVAVAATVGVVGVGGGLWWFLRGRK